MNNKLLKTLFKEKSLRLSHPRFLVYQELSNAPVPQSPQELYHSLMKGGRKVGLTSIYRALDLFKSLGIVFQIIHGPNVRYKLCELEEHHHHVVCKACGEVVELGFCDISEWSNRVTESTGYEVTDHQLNFYGLCRACKKGV